MATGSDYLGRGWAFPVQAGGGAVLMAAAAGSIAEAILIILQTVPGERVMLPGFGCRINELVFAENNATTASLAQLYVKQGLERWEPRIAVSGVTAQADPGQANCLQIVVDYVIRARNQPANLVYPFFLK
ncbi:GPW/gp25 family protein [Undibacterium sp. Di26W]|uniref:GPW/gp25 family protein n=1 Tax=Undibacterium sp. Di26W TaxID=3413035 RepID=UPI003BEFDFB7